MTLGERLKEIRKDLNKDLKTFSDDLGISYQSFYNKPAPKMPVFLDGQKIKSFEE